MGIEKFHQSGSGVWQGLVQQQMLTVYRKVSTIPSCSWRLKLKTAFLYWDELTQSSFHLIKENCWASASRTQGPPDQGFSVHVCVRHSLILLAPVRSILKLCRSTTTIIIIIITTITVSVINSKVITKYGSMAMCFATAETERTEDCERERWPHLTIQWANKQNPSKSAKG